MILGKEERLEILISLGDKLSEKGAIPEEIINKAYQGNPWFIPESIKKAFSAISNDLLNREELENWFESYPLLNDGGKTVGLIMAGNIPMVGFHDLITVFAAGHKAQIKLSSKDEVLMQFILQALLEVDERTKDYFEVVERLSNFNAVIATGSNNTSRYFEYYFGKYPHIIRRNRNGIAVLTGKETDEDLRKLSLDVFDYFGLGCRSITKLYVPENYDFNQLLGILDEDERVRHHNKYRNNYDYNYALYLLNKEDIKVSTNLVLRPDTSYLSRIACLHYENYFNMDELKERLIMDAELLQCIATTNGDLLKLGSEVKFGETQQPGLMDYADGVDTLEFLIKLT